MIATFGDHLRHRQEFIISLCCFWLLTLAGCASTGSAVSVHPSSATWKIVAGSGISALGMQDFHRNDKDKNLSVPILGGKVRYLTDGVGAYVSFLAAEPTTLPSDTTELSVNWADSPGEETISAVFLDRDNTIQLQELGKLDPQHWKVLHLSIQKGEYQKLAGFRVTSGSNKAPGVWYFFYFSEINIAQK